MSVSRTLLSYLLVLIVVFTQASPDGFAEEGMARTRHPRRETLVRRQFSYVAADGALETTDMQARRHLLPRLNAIQSPFIVNVGLISELFAGDAVQAQANAIENELAPDAVKPGGVLDGYGHRAYKMDVDMYPSVLDDLKHYKNDTIVKLLTPIKTYPAKVHGKFAYATSLFKVPVKGYEGFKDKLHEKFLPMLHSKLKGLKAGVHEFVLYTTADLAHEFTKYEFATVHVMEPHPELKFFPMLWRFLAMNSKRYDYVAIVDADYDWEFAEHWKQGLRDQKQWAITRFVPDMASEAKWTVKGVEFANYPPIIASRILVRPKLFDLKMAKAIGQYVALRNAREASNDPRITAKGEKHSVFNAPIGEHRYGWGNEVTKYGFCQGFLKRVVYYHFAIQGKLGSWNCQSGRRYPFTAAVVQADLDYVKSKGNYVHQGC